MAMKKDAQSAGKSNQLNSVVMDAIKNGRESTALFMLNTSGINLNHADEDGTLLAQAKWNGLQKVTAKLEAMGASLDRNEGALYTTDILYEVKVPPPPRGRASVVLDAIKNGRESTALFMLGTSGINLNHADEDGTLLAQAKWNGLKKVVAKLEAQGASLDRNEGALYTAKPLSLPYGAMTFPKLAQPELFSTEVTSAPVNLADFSFETYSAIFKPKLDEPLSLTRRIGGFIRKALGLTASQPSETAPVLDEASASTTMRVSPLPFPTHTTVGEKIGGFLRQAFGKTAARASAISLDAQGARPSVPQLQ